MSDNQIPDEAYSLHGGPYPFSISKEYAKRFYEYDFGLRDPESTMECVAAVFDLGGFTDFCAHCETPVDIPLFLQTFLTWLNRKLLIYSSAPAEERDFLKHKLPICRKYTGDGLLILWDATGLKAQDVLKIAFTCYKIVSNYQKFFEPHFRIVFPTIPPVLRVGIARGTAFPFANHSDFAGNCINLASRIQHLSGISFGIAKEGLSVEPHTSSFGNVIAEKRFNINGLGEQPVYILQREFDAMSLDTQKLWI